jgi:hypothetical protein
MLHVGAYRYLCADLLCRDIWPMFRAVVVRSFWVVLFGTGLAFAQDPPPLEGPASEPEPPKVTAPQTRPATPPTATQPPSPSAAAPSHARPILVIPGVTAPPTQRSGAATRPNIPQPSRPSMLNIPAPTAAGSSIASPPNLVSPFRPNAGGPGASVPEASLRDPIPLTLEPLGDESVLNSKDRGSTSPRGNSARAPASRVPVESGLGPSDTRPAPRRMPGLLGRILGQPSPSTARDVSRDGEAASRAKTKAKTKSEPDTDAVVKRRIEQQIRTTLGDKVQSVEVRVSGRNLLIVGRATRFWQKRSVYRTLESLPALAGFRARIDLDN